MLKTKFAILFSLNMKAFVSSHSLGSHNSLSNSTFSMSNANEDYIQSRRLSELSGNQNAGSLFLNDEFNVFKKDVENVQRNQASQDNLEDGDGQNKKEEDSSKGNILEELAHVDEKFDKVQMGLVVATQVLMSGLTFWRIYLHWKSLKKRYMIVTGSDKDDHCQDDESYTQEDVGNMQIILEETAHKEEDENEVVDYANPESYDTSPVKQSLMLPALEDNEMDGPMEEQKVGEDDNNESQNQGLPNISVQLI